MKIIQAGICDVGLKREKNQDSILILSDDRQKRYLYVVADGMGGHSDGEVASSMITEGITEWWKSVDFDISQGDFHKILFSLQDKVVEINKNIVEYRKNEICGSTCIILLIYENRYGIISAGDSRIYMKRGFKVKSVMSDDVWENQSNIKENLTSKQIKSDSNYGKLVNAVGVTDALSLSIKTDELKINDAFLLCSDGLYKYCTFRDIKTALNRIREDKIKDLVEKLLRIVYKNGAKDNVSIILVKNV